MCTLVRTQGLSGVKLGGGVTVQAPTGEETDGSPFPPHAPGPLCFMKIEIYCQTQDQAHKDQNEHIFRILPFSGTAREWWKDL